MQHLACDELWSRIKSLSGKARRRSAAVAYVSSDKIVKFQEGDILVVDASDVCIKSSDTSAEVLRRAFRRGAHIFSLHNLHAKVLVFDRVAVIGSANVSKSSASALVEAGVITDDRGTVAQAKALIDQLTEESEEVDSDFIDRICRIPVKRRPRRGGGRRRKRKIRLPANRTWLVRVDELREGAFPDEADAVSAGEQVAKQRLSTRRSDVTWIRFVGRSRFRSEATEGDSVIQIWCAYGDKRQRVYRHAPILYRQDEGHWTRFYLEESAENEDDSMPLGEFKKFVQKLGLPGRVGPLSCREIPPEYATALDLLWGNRPK